MKKLTAILVALTLLVTLCGSALAADTYTIKFAYTQGDKPREESAEIMYAELFKEYCEANGNGQLKVELYPSGQLGTAAGAGNGAFNLRLCGGEGSRLAIGFHHAVVQAASARRAEGAGRRANACLQRFAPLGARQLEVVDADGGGGRFLGGRSERGRADQSERDGENGGTSDHDGSP